MKLIFSTLMLSGLLTLANASNAQTSTLTTMRADSVNLSDYAGVYTFESGSPVQKFTVSADKNDLLGEADSYGKNKLLKQPKTDTYQSTSSYGSIITFIRDKATKAVTGLTLSAQGTELTAKKETK